VFFSNDIRRHEKVDTVPITENKDHAAFTMEWGLPYRGWIDWCPSGKLDVQPAAKPVPGKHEPQAHSSAPAPAPVLPDVHLLRVQPGQSNGEVKLVQKALQRMGVECGPVDGVFGPVTQKGYTQWQLICGFKGKDANGAPGAKSLRALGIATNSFFTVA
jgi:peptidoglycan hydrolase-like protein with peptidoglycan-binding domain